MYLPHHKKRIMFVSDSTGWTNAGINYPSLVTKMARANIGHVTHINKGIGGTDSRKLAKIFDQLVRRNSSDLFVVNIGMNDASNNQVTVSDFTTYLSGIVDSIQFHHPNADIILCKPSTATETSRVSNLPSYRTAIGNVATSKGVYLCDFSTGWSTSRADSMLYVKQFQEAIFGNPTLVDKGTWNASTNSPVLTSGVGAAGDYYRVSNAGSTTIDGVTGWLTTDGIVYDGTKWVKVTLDFIHPIQAGQNVMANILFGVVQTTPFYLRGL